ncbi:hypothetical protein [Thiothrix eikelboomii]|uniref:hypothetical protein n=1 Tax=Thiothrix eikelboomii TaxID=92487 RepID=UPI003BAE3950
MNSINDFKLKVVYFLMDYGFHVPNMSFPVVGTLMGELPESETKNVYGNRNLVCSCPPMESYR